MATTWEVGAIKITRLVELEVPVPWDAPQRIVVQATPERMRETPWLYPAFVTDKDALMFAVQALLVQTPDLTLVVDTCVGNDKPRRMTGQHGLQTKFLQMLEAAGCPRDRVDRVVCTHLHVDHVGWNTMLVDGAWAPTFPNARYLIGRVEMEHARAALAADGEGESAQVFSDSVQPVFDAGLVDLVETDHQICPGIRLRPTVGHTPGHVSIDIESEGKRAIITGDFIHHPTQLANPSWHSPFDADEPAATALRKAMLAELADTETLVIGTHFATPTAGRIRRDGNAYRLDT